MRKYGYTLDGDSRFYIDTIVTQEYSFIIFCSQYVVNFIKDNIPVGSRHYMMDGTFGSIPKAFYQLLIIAIEYQNDVSIQFRSFPRIRVRPYARPPDLFRYGINFTHSIDISVRVLLADEKND